MSRSDAPDAPQHPPGAWVPPSAPPFGMPVAPPPHASASPGVSGPPIEYAPPVGYAIAPWPGMPVSPASTPTRRSPAVGLIALALALLATVGASIVGAIASFAVGLGAGRGITERAFTADFDWSILTPVRDQVLLGEVAFWTGTAFGLWALVQGIVAIVTARGRGAGIAAVVIAALGPIVFGAVVEGFLTAGLTAGTGVGG